LAIVVALWIGHALLWRYLISSTVPDDQDLLEHGESRRFVRLYDDMSLVHDLGAPAASDKLADLSYPPARRPVVKMWWEATTAFVSLQVRAEGDHLVFRWTAAPLVADRTV